MINNPNLYASKPNKLHIFIFSMLCLGFISLLGVTSMAVDIYIQKETNIQKLNKCEKELKNIK